MYANDGLKTLFSPYFSNQ